MLTSVTITHLEITDGGQLRPARAASPDWAVVRVPSPIPELNRFFYTAVGGDWYWIDRLGWTYWDWLKYLDRPELQTCLITVAGVPAGYFELELQSDKNVEIVYFGLLASFAGRGLGGWALTRAVEEGWRLGARRVWVHTCDLDHPAALANYRARGFREFMRETKLEELPLRPIGPWPGARE
jgi:GNAT superfamily N-acetyltransferase